jgi:hypothetical protein
MFVGDEANSSRTLIYDSGRCFDVSVLSSCGDVWKKCLGRKKSLMNKKSIFLDWIRVDYCWGAYSLWGDSFVKSYRYSSRMIWSSIM